MGVAVQLFPFDNIKFYQKIVPELRRGLKSTFLRSEFLAYQKTYFYFESPPDINILNNFDKVYDVEFKYHLDSINIQNKFSLSWYEETVRFFEYLVGHHCLDSTLFYSIGRYNPDLYFDKTIEKSIASHVIKKLSDWKLFWTHNGGGWNEGFRGWVTNEDVELLLLDLPSLKINDNMSLKEFDDFIQFLKILKSSNKGILCGADLILKIPPYKTKTPYGLQSYRDNADVCC
ncbi:hypothetical protein GCM10027035_10770 [Emticicia sediminis]